MKKIKLTFILLFAALFTNVPSSFAVKTVVTPEVTIQDSNKKGKFIKRIVSKKRQSIRSRIVNAKVKAIKMLQKLGVDFDSPVTKWLWYAIFGFAISVALSIVARFVFRSLLFSLSGIAGLFALIAFVIWLIKAFG